MKNSLVSKPFVRCPAGVRMSLADGGQEVSWYGADVLRVRAWKGRAQDRASLGVVASPEAPAEWSLEPDGDGVRLTGPSLSAHIAADGTVSFMGNGRVLLDERPGGRSFPVNTYPRPEDRTGAAQAFLPPAPAEALYGLGQYQTGLGISSNSLNSSLARQ